MADLPTGTVTFLFTDLEGSTRLWEQHPEAMKGALARHDELLRVAVGANGGRVVKTTGDGVHAVFASGHDALAAACAAQVALAGEAWGPIGPLRVRMGVHTGEAAERDGDYFGSALNRAARLMAVAHGGQVVVSEATWGLVRDELSEVMELVDLGEHRLRDLSRPERVFQLCAEGLDAEFPSLRSVDAFPGNLPRQVTSFVGRQEELAALAALVRQRPLVTLTGVGGVGKTRLAVQVAAEVLPEFPEGAWLCELAPVTDPDAIWETLAAALGVHPSPGRTLEDSVLEFLGPKRALVVLDNCEHLLEGAARVVTAITQRAPKVALLATSREGLALAGEQIVAVASLGMPSGDAGLDADAVRLFVDRAQDAKRGFVLSERNAGAVGLLCRRLDGIPLAIELAAARVRSLTPDDLVTRLDQRFRLLTRGSRAALERHQTLRHTIDWSYDLLTGVEQAALNRISVFAGGCALAAAEAVLPDDALDEAEVVDLLSSLVDKSLVLLDEDDDAGPRYRQLETIRQYAQEHLEATGEAPDTRRRHAEWYVALAEAAGPGLRGRDQIDTATVIARETDNLRAAVDWAVETESSNHALRLVAPLAVNGTAIGYAAMEWAEAAVAIPGAEEHPRFPAAAAWGSWGAVMHGDPERGRSLLARARAAQQRLGTTEPLVCQAAGVLAFFSGDLDGARPHAEEWVRVAHSLGDAYELAHALILLATALQFSDPEASIRHTEEAVHVARTEGIASATSIGLAFLASQLSVQDARDDDRLGRVLDEAHDAATEVGDRQALSLVAFLRGWLAIQRNDAVTALEAAAADAEQSLALGDVATITRSYGLGVISLTMLDESEPAAILLGAWRAARLSFTAAPPSKYLERIQFAAEVLVEQLGAEDLAELETRGAAMTHAELVGCLHATADRVLGDRQDRLSTGLWDTPVHGEVVPRRGLNAEVKPT